MRMKDRKSERKKREMGLQGPTAFLLSFCHSHSKISLFLLSGTLFTHTCHATFTPMCKFLYLFIQNYSLLFKYILQSPIREGQFMSLKTWRWREEPLRTRGSSFKSRLRDPSSKGSWLKSWSSGFKGGRSSRCLCRPEARSSQFQERWK